MEGNQASSKIIAQKIHHVPYWGEKEDNKPSSEDPK